jgi:hypothetical protein
MTRPTPHRRRPLLAPALLLAAALLAALAALPTASASTGDRLPEFRRCVNVCLYANCERDEPTPIPLLHRALLWSCPAECDYTCQRLVTSARVRASLPVVQFHGKWPFTRVLGMQEPLSVLFSLGNLLAHVWGLRRVRAELPPSYPLRAFYERVGQIGILTWACSAVFHTRDFVLTEQADYLAAGASVMYGLYYAAVRVFRLDRGGPGRRRALWLWSAGCRTAYALHVAYLTLWSWDYTYNMAANVVVGAAHNALWSWFSWNMYRRVRRLWAVVPGIVVTWIMLAMSLELFDFAPLGGFLDAHSLWHLGTIAPAMIMYNFLIVDLARHGLHITPIMVSLVEDAVTVAGVSTSSTTEDNLQTLP